MGSTSLIKKLEALGACEDALRWVKRNNIRTAGKAWDNAPNPGWLLWALGYTDFYFSWPLVRSFYEATFEEDKDLYARDSMLAQELAWVKNVMAREGGENTPSALERSVLLARIADHRQLAKTDRVKNAYHVMKSALCAYSYTKNHSQGSTYAINGITSVTKNAQLLRIVRKVLPWEVVQKACEEALR